MVRLYSVLDTVVVSGEDVCCSVMFGTLVGMFLFSVMWSELHVLLFVLHVCMLRECEGARVTEMLVWGPGELWLRRVRIWVVHVVQVFCLVHVSCKR